MTEADLLYVVRGAHQKFQAREEYVCGLTGAVPYDFTRGIPFTYWHRFEREIKRRLRVLAALRVGENEHGPVFHGNRLRVDFKQRPGEPWRVEVTLGEVTVTHYLGASPARDTETYQCTTSDRSPWRDADIDWKVTPPSTATGENPDADDSKKMMEQTTGHWIIENEELRGMSSHDRNALKAYLSRQEDKARMAYDRKIKSVKRQFIIIGTTGDNRYLSNTVGEATIDGLTAAQCLARMKMYQDESFQFGTGRPKRDDYMTPAQWDAARAAWSAELRSKTDASANADRAKARENEIVVDDDRWEP